MADNDGWWFKNVLRWIMGDGKLRGRCMSPSMNSHGLEPWFTSAALVGYGACWLRPRLIWSTCYLETMLDADECCRNMLVFDESNRIYNNFAKHGAHENRRAGFPRSEIHVWGLDNHKQKVYGFMAHMIDSFVKIEIRWYQWIKTLYL